MLCFTDLALIVVYNGQCTHLRTYTVAVSSAIRGGALSVAGGRCVLAYLHWGHRMTPREVRLVEGIIYRTYFAQFIVTDQQVYFTAPQVLW